MAGVKGRSGVYERTPETLNKLKSRVARVGKKNVNWKGGIFSDKKLYFKEYWAKYKEEHRDKVVANRQSMRMKRKKVEGKFTAKQWNNLMDKYSRRCVHCGVHDNVSKMTVDHIIPLSKGGTNYIDNIQPLCFKCNRKKSNLITTS